MTNAELLDLVNIPEKRDRAIEELIEQNMKLVGYIAKMYRNIDYDEVISNGMMGLYKAICTYDSNKSTNFGTYAATCIRNEINMFLRSERKHKNLIHLDDPIMDFDENKLTYESVIQESNSRIIERTELNDEVRIVKDIINNCLNDKEKKVMQMRYDFDTGRLTRQQTVAEKLDLSRSYISRLENKAIISIRDHRKLMDKGKE